MFLKNFRTFFFTICFIIIASIVTSTHADPRSFKFAWDPSVGAAGYMVYWAYNSESALQIAYSSQTGIDIGNVTSYCLTVEDFQLQSTGEVIKGVFFSVSAYNSAGTESGLATASNGSVGYWLFGNIDGTLNTGGPQGNGVLWQDARVDGFDYNVFGSNFGLQTNHNNPCSPQFGVLQLPNIETPLQSSDLNSDGRVDGGDYNYFGWRFGNTLNQ